MKTFGCCLLALILLLTGALLTSCKEEEELSFETTEDATEEIPADKYAEYGFETIDLEQRSYCILTLAGYNSKHHFVVDDIDGTTLNEAAFSRTQYVNEVYNCNLTFWEGNPDLLINDCIMGGTHDFDLVYPHPTSSIVKMMTSNYFANLLECDTLRLDEKWWNQSHIDTYSVNNKLFLAVSDYSITGQGITGILYNKKLYKDAGFNENLYQIVKDGNWTMERLHTMVKQFGGDTNGDTVIDEKDTFGLAFQGGYAAACMYAMDQYIFDYSGEEIKLAVEQESISRIAQKLYSLLWESDQRVYIENCVNAGWPTSNLWKIYSENRALFMTFDVGGMFPMLSNLPEKPGYLPLPKFDDAQKDYNVFCASGFFAIPNCAEDIEKSGLVLDALSYLSYVDMRPAFFERILGGRMSDHPEDYEMLNFLHSKKVYDLGYTMDEGGYVRDMLKKIVVDGRSVNTSSYWRMNSTFMNTIVTKLKAFP
ncbi:MAG: hypothetical protein IJZ80_07230 [Clostridia bacterium]|nr:hypothetical protein [Clostridia bacterium]